MIATASNDDDRAACEAVGAQHVVNHRDAGWHEAVLEWTGGRPVDRVVDVEFGANLPEVLEVIRTSGTIATYSSTRVPEPALPFFRMMYLDLNLRFVIVYAMPEGAKAAAIADITGALADDALEHRIAGVMPLDDIAGAHELIESGDARGCIVIDTR